MKRGILIIVLILLMSSIVSAGVLDWLSGKASYDPMFGFEDDSLSPVPLPENLGIPSVWTNKNPSLYRQGDEFVLWAKVIDSRADYGPLLKENGGSVLYSLVSDSIQGACPGPNCGWKLLIPYTEMIYDESSGYYYAKAIVPKDISDEALKGLRVLVDASNGEDMIRFVGGFSPVGSGDGVTTEICDNRIDDDNDGLADCFDSDCSGFSACRGVEICDNRIDDDNDGLADCFDDDCAGSYLCTGVSEGAGREYTLNIGDTVLISGKMLKLMNIGTDGTVFVTLDDDLEAHIALGETGILGPLKIKNTIVSSPIVKSNLWHMEVGIAYSIPQDNKPYDVTVTEIGTDRAIGVTVNGFSEVIPFGNTETVNGLEITYNKDYVSLIVGKDIVYDDPIDGTVFKSARRHMKIGTTYSIPQDNKPYDVTVTEIGTDRAIGVTVNGFSEVIPFGNTETVNGLEITNDGKFVTLIIGKEFVDKSPAYAVLFVTSDGPFTTIEQSRANLIIGRSGAYYLDVGDEVRVEGKMIKLMTVSPDSVSVTVDGRLGHISRCATKTFVGIEIRYEPKSCLEVPSVSLPEKIITTPSGEKAEMPFVPTFERRCDSGCLMENNVCVPFGTRVAGSYCSISKQFESQKELKASCENSYECKSNECSDGECISTAGLLQRILDILSKIFGK